jgi:hypothetical protein
MARSLLIHARLPDTFWYHALAYATYIFNVLPVRGLQDLETEIPATPHELFFGTKPHISHLQTFGCPVIIRKWTTSDNTNGKQTERGLRGIFIGLDMHQKGYVIFCPGSRSIVISDDVIFDENFTSAIAQTWQNYQDGIALRPIASFVPDVTTTLEQTGTVADAPASVEEGNLIDLTTPVHKPEEPVDDTPTSFLRTTTSATLTTMTTVLPATTVMVSQIPRSPTTTSPLLSNPPRSCLKQTPLKSYVAAQDLANPIQNTPRIPWLPRWVGTT